MSQQRFSAGPGQHLARLEMFRTAALLSRQGRLAEAASLYEALLKSDPRNFDCLRELGSIRFREGKFNEAILLIGRALDRKPNSAGLQNNLGAALAALGRFREALRHYRKAAALEPDHAEALTNIGRAHMALQDPQAAIPFFEKAISAKPESIAAYHGLGDALDALGRPDDALHAFETAIRLTPGSGVLHRRFAECRRYAEADPHLGVMEDLLGDAALPQIDRVHLHAALAKAYDDLRRPQRSFDHVLEGNRLQRMQFTYREGETLALLQRIQTEFTAQMMAEKQGLGHASSAPIFIVGMPRSGSTLVEQILASHPRVFGAGEIKNFDTAITSLGRGRFESASFLDTLPSLTRKHFHRLGAAYLASIEGAPPAAQRITNKLLGNFLYVGLIHLALPNAPIVHISRDAVDTCVSRFSKLLVPGQAYSYDLAELGRYHRAYETLMDHWRNVLAPGVMLEVRYEDVVDDLEAQARRLTEHCGLEWDAACLSFHKTERAVLTPSASQVRQPLYGGAVGRWRRHEAFLQPLLQALGRDSDL
jgi:tetratricopeptide (TPR) repeat protein